MEVAARVVWCRDLSARLDPWHRPTLSHPVIDASGNAYVGGANGTIYQLDEDTGAIEASRTADPDPSALVQEMTLHSTDAGVNIVLVSATSAGQVAKHDIPFCQPGACLDDDSDGDGVFDVDDNCPLVPMRTRRMRTGTGWAMPATPTWMATVSPTTPMPVPHPYSGSP